MEQVQLDMQMMGKLHELKHQHDKHANAIKERDMTLIVRKQTEDIVHKLQAELPQYEQERDAVQHEVLYIHLQGPSS
jgi:uncharacterized protein YlxW (UPF0749 family)